MPTDAKCGLLVGVGLVIAAAILFFQNDPNAPKLAIPNGEVRTVTQQVKPPVEKTLPAPPLLPVHQVSRVHD